MNNLLFIYVHVIGLLGNCNAILIEPEGLSPVSLFVIFILRNCNPAFRMVDDVPVLSRFLTSVTAPCLIVAILGNGDHLAGNIFVVLVKHGCLLHIAVFVIVLTRRDHPQ